MKLTGLKDTGYAGNLSFETFSQVKGLRLPGERVPVFPGTIADIRKYFPGYLTDKGDHHDCYRYSQSLY